MLRGTSNRVQQRVGLAFLVAGLLSPSDLSAWKLAPLRTAVEAPPGGYAVAALRVQNPGDRVLRFDLELMDWTLDASGRAVFSAPGTLERGAAGWVDLSSRRLEVPAGGAAEAQYAISLPSDAEGSYHAAIEVIPADEPGPAKGLMITTKVSMVHLITVHTRGKTTFSAEIEEFRVSRPDDTGSLEVMGRLRNIGNGTVRPEGTFTLVDERGRVTGTITLTPRLTPPGTVLNFRQTWDGLLTPGRYRVLGMIELTNDQVLTPEISFEVIDRLELAGISTESNAEGIQARVSVANAGNITHHITGTIRIRPGKEGPAEALQHPVSCTISSLPGVSSETVVPLGPIPSGEWILAVALESGTHRMSAEHPFSIP